MAKTVPSEIGLRRNLRMMLFLVTCLASWNLSSNAVIRPVRSPTQDPEEWRKDWKVIPPSEWKKLMPDETTPPTDSKKFTTPDSRTTPAHINWNGIIFDRNLLTGHRERFSLPPIDWERFSLPPIDWDRPQVIPTIKPFYWDRPTFKPFDWDRPLVIPTIKPFYWDRPTFKPFDWDRRKDDPDHYLEKRSQDDYKTWKLVIILPITVGIFITYILKYFVSHGENNSDGSAPIDNSNCSAPIDNSDGSSPILHPPPTRREFTNPQSRVSTSNNQARQELLSPDANSTIPPGNTGSSQGSDPLDHPPDYSAVVLDDFIKEGQTKFPSVLPTIPDTPPPQYDDKSMEY